MWGAVAGGCSRVCFCRAQIEEISTELSRITSRLLDPW